MTKLSRWWLLAASAAILMLATVVVVVIVVATGGSGRCGPSVSDAKFTRYNRPTIPYVAPNGQRWETFQDTKTLGLRVNREQDGRWVPVDTTALAGLNYYGGAATSSDGHLLVTLREARQGFDAVPRYLAIGDGRRWQRGDIPQAAGYDTDLNGMAIRSGRDAWAVGAQVARPSAQNLEAFRRGIPDQPFAMHWDGSSWHATTLPGNGFELDAVLELGPHDVWAGGALTTTHRGNGTQLLLHWNGETWSRVALPADEGRVLQLTGTHTGSAWAVIQTGDSVGRLLHWNGRTWSVAAVPDGHAVTEAMAGCGGLWTIGSRRSGTTEVGFRADDGTWTFRTTPTDGRHACPTDGLSGAPGQDTIWVGIHCVIPDGSGNNNDTPDNQTLD